MWRSPEPRYDVASAIAQGGRDYQEDAITTDFPFGMDSGVAVLADGMGGHAAGDVASKIVVTEVYSELKFQSANFADFERDIPAFMRKAAKGANSCVRDHVRANPGCQGMGATLVSVVLVENRMYWMSIGDSPLYLLRDGKLCQLNEDHSLAPQIDFMVEQGLISAEAAKNHPDRNCLTSVILGGKVARADCPMEPFELKLGDVVVVSSDGLQYLEEPKIRKILHKYRRRKAAEIAGYLLEALDELADPDQDNISFSVIKLNHMKPVVRKIVAKPVGLIETYSAPATRVAALPDVGGVAIDDDTDPAGSEPMADPDEEEAARARAEIRARMEAEIRAELEAEAAARAAAVISVEPGPDPEVEPAEPAADADTRSEPEPDPEEDEVLPLAASGGARS
ncbi:PP2C family protein-serine/threonine phosphatase [Jannaschia seohaensis]|uniref:Serine/threonine protein phosphatase PrpC n=1 Tax=Jannaschia seohaensis TaxID=475081 RepID=A0A2Y9B376_9RHOB|nr:protein phosphatase 2C domain-containing protein [Jannaschia seohaensis]PWJ12499.1 serine/threonine protein phosphatase PrpC [Jannaschia seohaensis]SSA50980.1 Serine/threonine protein phosphatase PrpC [Jannaschia seohaensis]